MVGRHPPEAAAITIVGLGPGNPAQLTREAWEVLTQAREVYLRTSRHPTASALPSHLVLHSFDYLYEASDDFLSLYDQIAAEILERARRPQGVVYAVPGHPLVGETSVRRILAGARQDGLSVRVVDGLSFVEPVLGRLGVDALDGLQLADAMDLAAAHYPQLNPDRPALVGQLYGWQLASDVKLTLMSAYPDNHPVTLVRAAGMADASAHTLPLYELDRSPLLDHLTSLYVPPLCEHGGLPSLQQTIASLRAPGGCPWDQEQTHQSLRPHLLEESYEVLAALDSGDLDKLSEELGDLLMQIVMHAQIATEEGRFRLCDVIAQIDAKLRRRHPHVFGEVQVRDADEVLRNWQAIKRDEAEGKGIGEDRATSILAGVPALLPALARAQQISERAARAGFEWANMEGVLDKLAEEVGELCGAGDSREVEAELGDVLFTLTNVARWLRLDAESALRLACDRFSRRYGEMERQARCMGVSLSDLPMSEQESLWQRAKERD